jgi:2-keto-4-pentenoate hydratase/2-oxohepta-3-ene-1,7-dioic acid hydratase in catechol pathway
MPDREASIPVLLSEAFMRRVCILAILCGTLTPISAQRSAPSSKPDTPFKLATFETAGKARVGLVLGTRVLDIAAANAALVADQHVPAVSLPAEMRGLIENYSRLAPRLYQIANFFKDDRLDGAAFAFDAEKVSIRAPIKYPYNLLAIAANYRLHAGEMFPPGSPQQKAADSADPDQEDPVFFAKSPRSCIIDPGEAYIMPPGRNIDWEGELAIVVGKQAFGVALEKTHDYVFGYSIMYDVSDRGGSGRPLTGMFPGPNWFNGKSRDRSAPFGPFIVPKEFVSDYRDFHITTKVNGVVKQDG